MAKSQSQMAMTKLTEYYTILSKVLDHELFISNEEQPEIYTDHKDGRTYIITWNNTHRSPTKHQWEVVILNSDEETIDTIKCGLGYVGALTAYTRFISLLERNN